MYPTPEEHRKIALNALSIIADNVSINVFEKNWQKAAETVGYGRGYLAAIRHLNILSEKELNTWAENITHGKAKPRPKNFKYKTGKTK